MHPWMGRHLEFRAEQVVALTLHSCTDKRSAEQFRLSPNLVLGRWGRAPGIFALRRSAANGRQRAGPTGSSQAAR